MRRISGEVSPQGASENLRTQQRTELRSAAGKFKQTTKGIAAKRLPLWRRPVGAHHAQRQTLTSLPRPAPDSRTFHPDQDAQHGKDSRP